MYALQVINFHIYYNRVLMIGTNKWEWHWVIGCAIERNDYDGTEFRIGINQLGIFHSKNYFRTLDKLFKLDLPPNIT